VGSALAPLSVEAAAMKKPGTAQRHRPLAPRPSLDWMNHMACRDANPTIFTEPEMADFALSFCRRCTVTAECEDLMTRNASRERSHRPQGVWGGKAHYPRQPGRPKR